jgi:hypothetical protein
MVLREAPARFYLILKEHIHRVSHIFSFGATRTRLIALTTIPLLLMTQIYATAISSFDMDSSFLVCNNSATGHICNDKSLFSGELVPSIYFVGAATGSSKLTLMGTVILCLTDDNGAKHTFTLTHVNYMPKSPVNILSKSSKQFSNEIGFDQQGTGNTSVFDDHTLFLGSWLISQDLQDSLFWPSRIAF